MGTIHAGKSVKPGGRYDCFLRVLREAGDRGATTAEIIDRTEEIGWRVCAVSAVASELRAMGYVIECDPVPHPRRGGTLYRYWLRGAPGQLPKQRDLFA